MREVTCYAPTEFEVEIFLPAEIRRKGFAPRYEQENPMTKAKDDNREPNSEKHELSIDELNAVNGGTIVRDHRSQTTTRPVVRDHRTTSSS